MASMNYIQLVNDVLVRLREPEASSVSDTAYVKLIAKFVNDSKRVVEDAYNWNSLTETLSAVTAQDVFNYVLVGSGQRFRVIDIINDTTNTFVNLAATKWMDQQFLMTTPQKGSPQYYNFNGTDANGDTQVDLYPIPDGVYNDNAKIQTDNYYFNKAVLYNGQQSTGLLELVKKPAHSLAAYNQYPIYNAESKTITFTKSDSFYQYNTFWNVVKDKLEPLFNITCESLSIDKAINQANMDYGTRSFRKDPLRAKGLLIRHILDNRSDIHMVSQFIVAPSQISYK